MNVEQSLKILRGRNIHVRGTQNNWEVVGRYKLKLMSDRQLINYAREFTSERNRTQVKATVKKFTHRGNRSRTRQWIEKRQYDRFTNQHLAYVEDEWAWD